MKREEKKPGTFKRFAQFTKVAEEPEGIRVWAIATKEELDRQGEVVSYDASKVAFKEFADWFEKTTTAAGQDPSKGAVRVMHTNQNVGKMIEWSADDANRQIPVSLLVTDKEQGRKVKNGEYTGISIGGDQVCMEPRPWEGKSAPWITKYRLGELSLVDTPACDSAVFVMVKRADLANPGADGREIAFQLVIPPAIPLVPLPVTAKAEKESTTVQTLVFDKDKFNVETAKKWASDHAFKAGKVDEPETGNAIRLCQRNPEDFKQDMRTIELKPGVKAVIGELKLFGGRFGKALAATAPALRKYAGAGMSIYPALCALRDLQNAIEAESFEADYGPPENAATEKAEIELLAAAIQSIMDFLGSEYAEQARMFLSSKPAAEEGMALVARVTDLAKALSPVQLQKLAEEPDVKENMTAMHQMGHALVKATQVMGADCPGGECSGGGSPASEEEAEEETEQQDAAGKGKLPPDEEKETGEGQLPVKAAVPVVLKGSNPGNLQKVLDAVSKVAGEVKGLGEVVAAVKASADESLTLSKANDELLKRIGKAPAPVGRPAPRTTDKSLGAGGEMIADQDGASVLQKLAAEEKDPHVRQVLVMKAASMTVPPYAPQQ